MTFSKDALARLVGGAMGEIKADLIITGGRVINVYSGEILDGMEIAVLDGRICYVGPSARHTKGIVTEIRDASGSFVSPGFIDGHTHIGHYARPFENLQSLLPHGTTAVVASCDELSSVFGFRGLKLFLDEVEKHPLRVYTLVSMAAPRNYARWRQREFRRATSRFASKTRSSVYAWVTGRCCVKVPCAKT
ncbi:MAG TPA: hypothetical protein VGW77_11060 [Candidatus Binatia bacterium]|jgi:adenine deaminase|nr:hypothetical protein [Candidatus Binatia bacterium]